jgi:hypothetical protein
MLDRSTLQLERRRVHRRKEPRLVPQRPSCAEEGPGLAGVSTRSCASLSASHQSKDFSNGISPI